jgi:two-component system response regulator FixJ
MELVVAGKVSKQIAAELGLSKKTVDVHRAHVMEKMGVMSVAQLVEQVIAARTLPGES